MNRPEKGAAARAVPISARFTEAEADELDRMRGPLSRSMFLRYLFNQARKQKIDLRTEGT